MKKDILVGIDIGSSNIKTVFFNDRMDIVANESNEIEIIFPKPGWSEYNPNEWWKNVRETLRRALANSSVAPERILGIGVSSLGCCAVPLDESGNALYNAIPWSDQRAEKEVKFLVKNCRDGIFDACGNMPSRLSATPHLLWIKNSEPDIYRKIYKYTEASGYITQKLTGSFVLDHSMASGLDYGFDTKTLDYNEELIEAMGLDMDKYPVLIKNTDRAGTVTEKAAGETGLIQGTPVFLAGLDIVSAAISGGAIEPGQGYYSMGSASNMMLITRVNEGTPNLSSLLHIVDPDIRCFFGSQGSVGYSLKWFRDQFGGPEKSASSVLEGSLDPFEILTAEAAKTRPGAGGLLYLPFLFGKFHPAFNEHAQGVLFGMNATTTKPQVIRALMEGCTYNMYETIKESQKIGIDLQEILTSGGPSRSPLWCQIIADVTNCKVVTIDTPEASPMGNALLVGVAVGFYESFRDTIARFVKKDREYIPSEQDHGLYEDLFSVYNSVYDLVSDDFRTLVRLREKHGLS